MYSCNKCQILYSTSKELSDHVKTSHSISTEINEERVMIIKCPDCDTKFNNMRSLNCHMRYHRNGTFCNIVQRCSSLLWSFAFPQSVQSALVRLIIKMAYFYITAVVIG